MPTRQKPLPRSHLPHLPFPNPQSLSPLLPIRIPNHHTPHTLPNPPPTPLPHDRTLMHFLLPREDRQVKGVGFPRAGEAREEGLSSGRRGVEEQGRGVEGGRGRREGFLRTRGRRGLRRGRGGPRRFGGMTRLGRKTSQGEELVLGRELRDGRGREERGRRGRERDRAKLDKPNASAISRAFAGSSSEPCGRTARRCAAGCSFDRTSYRGRGGGWAGEDAADVRVVTGRCRSQLAAS